RDLPGTFDVLFIELDLYARSELAPSIVFAPQAEKTGIRNSHPSRLVRKIDRSLLNDAVDVIPPRIVVEQAVDRQLQLIVQPVQHPSDASRRLAPSVGKNAIVSAPEFVLVESAPDGVLFDMKNKLGSIFFELHDVLLKDRRNAVTAGTHA